ncbi:MAG TPA: M23 family metallopeptidase [Nocardioidaceae bacterium]|nr:M23 family metallopeptidase [Nocardioidaceae bacterium]
MANHRAEKRDASRVDPDERSGVTTRRAASGGKRKAVAPAKRARIRSADAVITQRAGHSAPRKNLFRTLPSAPLLVGAAALVVAAGGAVTIGQDAVPARAAGGSIQRLSAQANVLNGASQVQANVAADSREQAVSRDSQREALEDAAEEELQAAAEAQAQQRNAALAQLAASAEKHADQIAANAWGLPVASGVYHLTAGFGQSSGLWAHTHTGLDFAAPMGTPIMSVARGVVTSTEYAGSYGNRTIVTLEDGTEIWYCHQSSFAVSPGEEVSAGQVIGAVGLTGNTTGPHLHLEVRPGAGDPVDPRAALAVHGLTP